MVVELRDASWWREDVYRVFREEKIWWVFSKVELKRNLTFQNPQLAHVHVHNRYDKPWMPSFPTGSSWQPPTRPITTPDLVYLRFHGTAGQYVGGYSKEFIKETVDWLGKSAKKEMWCGFNNTDDGWPANATVDSGRVWREAVRAWEDVGSTRESGGSWSQGRKPSDVGPSVGKGRRLSDQV
jgi:uncharacterized protein YecE (DUF72 family)